MADGMDAYIASLKLAQPISAFQAGAEVAAQHQRIVQQTDAKGFDQVMEILNAQSKARQASQQAELAQARLAETARQNDARNGLTEQHYKDQRDHWANTATTGGATGSALPQNWIYSDLSKGQPSSDATPAEQDWMRANDANPAPPGTQTDDTSSYAPGSAPNPGFSDGPVVPGGQSFPAEDQSALAARGAPMTRPTAQEGANLGGGLLPPPQQEQPPQGGAGSVDVHSLQTGQRHEEPNGPNSKVRYERRQDGNIWMSNITLDSHGRDKILGVPRILEKPAADNWTPPASPEPDANGLVSHGDGLGDKVVSLEGKRFIQPMVYKGGKNGSWVPRGTKINIPTEAKSDGSLPDPVVQGPITTYFTPNGKGGFSTKTINTPPDLEVQKANAAAHGLELDGWKMVGNNPVATKLKLSGDPGKADDNSPVKLISKLPAAERSQVTKAFDALLDPSTVKAKDENGVLQSEPSAKEKAAFMGKPAEQMTPEDWSNSRNAIMEKRRKDAAVTIADKLNTYLGKTPGYVPRSAQQWMQYVDQTRKSLISDGDGSDTESTTEDRTESPKPPGLPTGGFSDQDLQGMGLRPTGSPKPPAPPAPSWMKKLGIGG